MVTKIAVGLALNQTWPSTAASTLYCAVGGFKDCHDVLSVNDHARHSVCGGTISDILSGDCVFDRCRLRVPVVLADKDYREAPDCRHIHGFMNRPDARCALTEEGYAHLIGHAHLRR